MGAVLDLAPVKCSINWTNDAGEEYTFDVWIRRLSFSAAADVWGDSSPEKRALMLSKVVLLQGEKGPEPLAFEDAKAIHPTLGLEFVKKFNELNGQASKNSLPTTNSSANSSLTESAEEPSQKPESD